MVEAGGRVQVQQRRFPAHGVRKISDRPGRNEVVPAGNTAGMPFRHRSQALALLHGERAIAQQRLDPRPLAS